MTSKYIEIEYSTNDQAELDKLTIGSLRKAVLDGDVDNGSLMFGQIAGAVNELLSVQEIIDQLNQEAQSVFQNLTLD